MTDTHIGAGSCEKLPFSAIAGEKSPRQHYLVSKAGAHKPPHSPLVNAIYRLAPQLALKERVITKRRLDLGI